MSMGNVGDYSSLTVLIRRTWGDKEMTQEMTNRIEYDNIVRDLRDQHGPNAEVVCSVSTKISDSLKYGPGTWDKIPFSVEVFCSVKLNCAQTQEKLESAKDMAHDIARQSLREHLYQGFATHVTNIKGLYKELFEE